MSVYVGIDVHRKRSQVCQASARGRAVFGYLADEQAVGVGETDGAPQPPGHVAGSDRDAELRRPDGFPAGERVDPQAQRLVGGYGQVDTGDGKRTRRKVSGTTKAAVVDKLRDLRTQSADSEVRPGPRPPTLRPHHRKTAQAGPEAQPTSSLPNRHDRQQRR